MQAELVVPLWRFPSDHFNIPASNQTNSDFLLKKIYWLYYWLERIFNSSDDALLVKAKRHNFEKNMD